MSPLCGETAGVLTILKVFVPSRSIFLFLCGSLKMLLVL